MNRIAIILGSTRPNRKSETVGNWVLEHAQKRKDAEFEIVDLKTYELPLFDEPKPPSMTKGEYAHEHSKTWGEKIASFDGFVFVTPEYNHSTSGVLKNAIDYLHVEWNNKAAGFVSYGSMGGVRAVEHLRLILAELQVATVRGQVALSLFHDFEKLTTFKPQPEQEKTLGTMFDQLVAWTGALKPLRK
ncbi:MAG: NADPH-dependent FMN reductase [Archangium sp.]